MSACRRLAITSNGSPLYHLAARIDGATPEREGLGMVVQRRGDTIGRVVLGIFEGEERT
jgi:hypothetical protein